MFNMLLNSNLVEWLKGHLLACPFKRYFHFDCPGCGFQRSVLALFQGDLRSSLALYPATVPILIMVGFLVLHLKYQFVFGATVIKYLQLTIAIVIAVFYIYKLMHLKTTL